VATAISRPPRLWRSSLIGAGSNPNVAAVVVIGIEDGWTRRVVDGIAATGKPVTGFGIEGTGDLGTIAKASRAAKDFLQWKAFMEKYYPTGNLADSNNVFGYSVATLMTIVLKQCGDDLTRANVMKQAANLKNVDLPMLLPGIKVNTSPTDFYPLQSVQLQKFQGEAWKLFGDVLSNESASN